MEYAICPSFPICLWRLWPSLCVFSFPAPFPALLQTFDKVVGIFSQSLFHFNCAQAVTGTMEGKLVVWEAVAPPSRPPAVSEKPYSMKAIKLVHLQKDGITALAVVEK